MYLLGLDKCVAPQFAFTSHRNLANFYHRNALQSIGMGSKSSSSDPTEGGKEKDKTEVRLKYCMLVVTAAQVAHRSTTS